MFLYACIYSVASAEIPIFIPFFCPADLYRKMPKGMHTAMSTDMAMTMDFLFLFIDCSRPFNNDINNTI